MTALPESGTEPVQKAEPGGVGRWPSLLIALTPIGGFVVGVITGMGPVLSAFVERDVRNRVYEATYQDKNRALATQAELLKLQEDYLRKLGDIRDAKEQVEQARRRITAKEEEIDRIRDEQRRQIDALRSRYRRLETEEQGRAKHVAETKARADRRAVVKARVEHFRAFDCSLEVSRDGSCDRGAVAIFARSTPEEVGVFGPSRECLKEGAFDTFEKAALACEKYARAYFAKKGLTAEEVEVLLEELGTSVGAQTAKYLSAPVVQ